MTTPTDNPYGFVRETLERLVSSVVGLKLANAKDYKEFVPTAEQALQTKIEAMLDYVIGEDEYPAGRLQTQYRNKLRAEQRQRKAELNNRKEPK